LLSLGLTDTPTVHAKKRKQRNLPFDDLDDTPEGGNSKKLLNSDGKLKRKKHIRIKRLRTNRAMLRISPNQQSTSTNNRNVRQNNDPFLCKFLDIEAEGDEEESDDENIDSQISPNSFINDSSQLGYTQDELDIVEQHDSSQPCDQGLLPHHDSAFYRSIDNHQAHVDSFSTPVLNRNHPRTAYKSNHHSYAETQTSVESSDKGLGNMHFIRSVIDHHRKGGDADEIESEYLSLRNKAKESSPDNNNIVQHRVIGTSICETNTSAIHLTHAGPASHSLVSTNTEKEHTLTVEQKARIESNRQKAMKIRDSKMKLKKAYK